jgi:hypothetical protein
VVGFFVVAFASPYFVTSTGQNGGGMMGGSSSTMVGMMTWWFPSSGGEYMYQPGLWLLPVAFLVLMALGAIATGYLLIYPEIRSTPSATSPAAPRVEPLAAGAALPSSVPLESVLKALKPDERKVFEVLLQHEGTYLQKLMKSETGMSRLRVHRVVSRLAERGLVTVKPVGNTNEVSLVGWLKNRPMEGNASP